MSAAMLLIANGADAGAGDKYGEGTITHCVESGAEINGKNVNGLTPFDLAVRNGAREVAELLIAKGGI